MNPHEFYPRIARPMSRSDGKLWNPSLHLEPGVVAASRGQATALLRQLERICQTVEPGPATFDAYGHEIRNLLLLACMEVETHWRGVLEANGATRDRYITTDYAVLSQVLKLGDYAVRFPAFPALSPIRPFAGWGVGIAPTQSLPWYAAHNAVKHNRERAFSEGRLRHAFEAMSAVAVMLVAQYGPYGLGHQHELRHFFHLVEQPTWGFGECYFWAGVGEPGPTHLMFNPTPHPLIGGRRVPKSRGRAPVT